MSTICQLPRSPAPVGQAETSQPSSAQGADLCLESQERGAEQETSRTKQDRTPHSRFYPPLTSPAFQPLQVTQCTLSRPCSRLYASSQLWALRRSDLGHVTPGGLDPPHPSHWRLSLLGAASTQLHSAALQHKGQGLAHSCPPTRSYEMLLEGPLCANPS